MEDRFPWKHVEWQPRTLNGKMLLQFPLMAFLRISTSFEHFMTNSAVKYLVNTKLKPDWDQIRLLRVMGPLLRLDLKSWKTWVWARSFPWRRRCGVWLRASVTDVGGMWRGSSRHVGGGGWRSWRLDWNESNFLGDVIWNLSAITIPCYKDSAGGVEGWWWGWGGASFASIISKL